MTISSHKPVIDPSNLLLLWSVYFIYITRETKGDIMKKQQQKRGQFHLKIEEVERIIHAAENPRDRIIISLLYYCGLRREEIVNIQLSDIDYGLSRLRVRGKGDKERLVPVPAEVIQDIQFYIGKCRRIYLFPAVRKRRAPLTKVMVNRLLRLAAERAGVRNPNPAAKHVNPHQLRHSCARRLKDAGLSMEVIAQFLGHENIQLTLNTYGLPSADDVMNQVRDAMV